MLNQDFTSSPLALSKSAALGGLDELKEAIALLSLTNLGAENTPSSWLDDTLESMAVHYEDESGEWKLATSDSFKGVQCACRLQASVLKP